jgi:hypothetical protein
VHVEGEEKGEGETESEDKGEEDGEDGEREGDGEDALWDDCLGGFASGNGCRVDRKVIYRLRAVCVRMCKGVEALCVCACMPRVCMCADVKGVCMGVETCRNTWVRVLPKHEGVQMWGECAQMRGEGVQTWCCRAEGVKNVG